MDGKWKAERQRLPQHGVLSLSSPDSPRSLEWLIGWLTLKEEAEHDSLGTHLLQILRGPSVLSCRILIGQNKELRSSGQAGQHGHQDVLAWNPCGLRRRQRVR